MSIRSNIVLRILRHNKQESHTVSAKTPVTIAYGDGIGPEIMEATLKILDAAGAAIDKEVIEIGRKVYEAGHSAGIPPEAWESLRRTKVFLKAPITTPQGSGYKSLNVTIRKTLGLYANVRPCRVYSPFVRTLHPDMDLVIIRENEEDTYAGIEHRQTDQVVQCLKLISRPGCEKIVRYAFEYAVKHGRKKVSVLVKDNIMKLTDGLFHQVFKEIAEEYPGIQTDSWIIDIGAARLADTPEIFDVMVMPNLYGDILSDIAAQITGSVGLGPSANIGENIAMFEAIHGSAPPIAGQDIANPSGLLLAAVMMLVHLDDPEPATAIHNAWLKVIEEGIHTVDVYTEKGSRKKVGTKEFAEAIIKRLGTTPETLAPVKYEKLDRDLPTHEEMRPTTRPRAKKDLVGVDMFLDWNAGTPDELGTKLSKVDSGPLNLVMITNRGVLVWPKGMPETFCTDHWRCRYLSPDTNNPIIKHEDIINLLGKARAAGFDFIKTENLYNFDGHPGYSLGQGQ
ncbi:MAG: NADP-dependent isocitrate dehydrogenase [Candidatus Sumerlaeia bacterium]|nr:NADP-dependent isocitrate dehydrogenase [Candidatus Sumerlaeia bacterium]